MYVVSCSRAGASQLTAFSLFADVSGGRPHVLRLFDVPLENVRSLLLVFMLLLFGKCAYHSSPSPARHRSSQQE